MKVIYFCERSSCRGPNCWERKRGDRWVTDFWVAVGLAHWRARHDKRRQQVRRADIGCGTGWIIQEIR